jgi:hypothetical protein
MYSIMSFYFNNRLLIQRINKEFVVEYYNRKGVKSVHGAGQYNKIVTEEIALKHFQRVLKDKTDLPTIRFGRGLRTVFRPR